METLRSHDLGPPALPLRALRTRAGYTQAAFAEALGQTPSVVCRWEKGRHEPPLDQLPDMAAKLGVDIDTLVRSLLLTKEAAS